MIDYLIEQVEGLADPCMSSFRRILEETKFEDAWIQAQIPDPLPSDRYHRRLLHKGDNYELVLATWPVGTQTYVHNHGELDSHGMVRVLMGDIFNHVYEKEDEFSVCKTEEMVFHKDELIPVNKGLLHAMGNERLDGPAMSLHFYSPMIIDVTYWDPRTLRRFQP